MSEQTPVIDLKHVEIVQGGALVLKDVNLSVNPGEFVYLIGRTGSGKSSLLKLLYGELPVHAGEAHAAGFDLNSLKRRKVPYLRRKLGIVFQDFQLLTDRTVLKNLNFVMRSTGWKRAEMKARAEEVLALVGLENKGYKMPHELSGGEQQRVAIARALLNDPEVILADEPTGNLDPETSQGIMHVLMAIAQKGTAIVMATHDLNLMEKYNGRVVRVEDETLKELSTVQEFDPFKPMEPHA